ncbi:MAG: hypothetical protein R6V12_00590, partial [Candidatus Hydrogenedentota bacterium]
MAQSSSGFSPLWRGLVSSSPGGAVALWRSRRPDFLFGSFSFIGSVETVINIAYFPDVLHRFFCHTAMWQDKPGG